MMRLLAALGGIVALLWLFVLVIDWLEKEWTAMIADWPSEPKLAAEAVIPELAAARAPRMDGSCSCRACRHRPQEPCSDYDGD